MRAAIRTALTFLDRRDRRLLMLAVIVQMATSLLDLFGVVLIGLVGALSLAFNDRQTPPWVDSVVSTFDLGGLSDGALIAAIAGTAAALLLAKSVVSPLLMARVLRFLARREAIVSARLTREVVSRPITFIQGRSSQETSQALGQGVNFAVSVVLGQMAVALSESALLVLLSAVLLVVNPVAAVGAIAFFAVVGWGMQQVLGPRAGKFGRGRTAADTDTLRLVQEVIGAYREIAITDRRSFYIGRIEALRGEAAGFAAGSQLVNLLPKYISEAALVLGSFALAGVLFATEPIVSAVGTFALFLAAATRIMPSLLRLQGAALGMRIAAASAGFTLQLVDDLRASAGEAPVLEAIEVSAGYPCREHVGFIPNCRVRDVTFTYPGADRPALQDVNLVIEQGQSLALVGRSGSGKSTLADLILGLLPPDRGEVSIAGMAPSVAERKWPGAIGYVPQDVMLADDSVRANVALGLPRSEIDDEAVWDALRRAHLAEYLRQQPEGLDTPVGERGVRFSGGQRQRLGIARALFTRPRFLVLDEATSALDAETEEAITQMLRELEHDVTTVIVAHHLSTIRHVDMVAYLELGTILVQGTFDEVSDRVPAMKRGFQ